jgi:DNA polymerase-3 subunit epsilon
VVFTGISEARKRELRELAEARGLVVWPNVKRGVAAVIAKDPGSGSVKARKAREYGIPVVGEGVLG